MTNLGEMLELAAILSRLSPALIDAPNRITGSLLSRYVEQWHQWTGATLTRLTALPEHLHHAPITERGPLWLSAGADFIEVFAAGLVARVWGAVLTAADRTSGRSVAGPAAQDVLNLLEQAHQQVLHLLVHGPWLTLARAVEIDWLRRRIERWCDVFVGHLAVEHGLPEFAFDAARAREFGEEQLAYGHSPQREQLWDMYLFCLRSAALRQPLPTGPQAELRVAAVRSILAMLPERMFLGDGTPAALALTRLLSQNLAAEHPGTKWAGLLNPRRGPSRSPFDCLPPQ